MHDRYDLGFVSQAPLPPHERAWRHPSELAAAEREAAVTAAPPHGSRTLAMVSGTVGLLAVCLLVLSLTPDRNEAPVAVSATTTPAGAGINGRPVGIAAIGRFASEIDADAAVLVRPGLAVPIGDGRSALMTPAATSASGDTFDVRLTSGSVVQAAVVGTTETGLVVVTIATSDTAHAIADRLPGPDDIVTVLTDTPVTVPFDEVDELDLAEGTPILDRAGALIGLCTHSGGESTVVDVTGDSGAPSTDPSGSSPSTDTAGDTATDTSAASPTTDDTASTSP